jgi:hypothetical protein
MHMYAKGYSYTLQEFPCQHGSMVHRYLRYHILIGRLDQDVSYTAANHSETGHPSTKTAYFFGP